MTRHLGASIFLSVGIVVFFAIVLSRSESKPPPKHAAGASTPARRPPSAPTASRPDLTPGRALGANSGSPIHPASGGSIVSLPSFSAPSGLVQPVSRRRSRTRSRAAFTEVVEGETLADVAVRVYGSADSAPSLWGANRDILEHRDAPLDAGMLLRTP